MTNVLWVWLQRGVIQAVEGIGCSLLMSISGDVQWNGSFGTRFAYQKKDRSVYDQGHELGAEGLIKLPFVVLGPCVVSLLSQNQCVLLFGCSFRTNCLMSQSAKA